MHLHFLDVLIYESFIRHLFYGRYLVQLKKMHVQCSQRCECYVTTHCMYWVLTSVQPKPSFGIGNQSQGPTSVAVSKLIFFEIETFFFISKKFKFFSCSPLLSWEYEYLKA